MVLALLLFTVNALAAEPAACTLDDLTNSCKVFPPDGPELIPLKDGTYVPNFPAMKTRMLTMSLAEQQQQFMATSTNLASQVLDNNLKISQALDTVPDAKLPPRSKLYLLSSGILGFLFPSRPNPNVPEEIRLLWPLGDPKATIKPVKFTTAKAGIEQLLGEQVLKEIQAVTRSMENLFRTASKSDSQKVLETVSDERVKHVDALVKRTTDLLIGEILGGRAEGQLTPSEVEAIKKIRAIKPTPLAELKDHPVCAAPIPNAFYDPSDLSMNICPNFYNMPDSTIVSVIAHELGHSMDPCNSQFGTFTIDREKLNPLKKPDGGAVDEIIKSDERYQLLYFLDFQAQKPGEKGFPLSLVADPDTIQYFRDKGVIQPAIKGTPFDSYVFKDVYQCMRDKQGFRSIGEQEVRELAVDVTRSRAETRGSTYNRQADEDKIVRAFQAHPECIGTEKSSQMGEVMADYFGAKVLSAFMKDQPAPTSPEERVAPIGFFASIACSDRVEDKPGPESVNKTIQGALADFARLLDPHPVSLARLEKIFLGEGPTRAALCPSTKGGGVSPCSHDPKTVPRQPIAPAATTPGSAREVR